MSIEQEYRVIILNLPANATMTFDMVRESLEKEGFFNCNSLAWQLAKFGKCQWFLPRRAELAEKNAAVLGARLRGANILVGLEKIEMSAEF